MSSNQMFVLIFVWSMFSASHVLHAQDLVSDVTQLANSNPGWVDIDIHAQEAIEARFAGFFDARINISSLDSHADVSPEPEQGTIALTFKDFSDKPIAQSTELNGLFSSGRDRIPHRVELTLQRRDDNDAFDVKLNGVSKTPLVGVANVEQDSIVMRLQDGNPHTTVITLRRRDPIAHKSTTQHHRSIDQIL